MTTPPTPAPASAPSLGPAAPGPAPALGPAPEVAFVAEALPVGRVSRRAGEHGALVRDRVPEALRRAWVAAGHCPDTDVFREFRRRVCDHPARTAVVDEEGSLSYRELGELAVGLATRLAGAGVRVGDVVGIRLGNARGALAADLAVAALGAVALPWPEGHGWAQSRALLAASGARVLIAHDGAADADAHVLPGVAVVTPDQPPLPMASFTPPLIDPEAPARLLVSSGTEAAPKMTAYSHNAMLGGRGRYVRRVLAVGDSTGDSTGAPAGSFAGSSAGDGAGGPARVLLLAPLASSYGSFGLVAVVRLGATLVLHRRFEPAAAVAALTSHAITHLAGVPTMLRRMACLPAAPGEDLSALRAVVSSGAPLDAAVLASALARFGRPVVNVYGSGDGVNCIAVHRDPGSDVHRAGRPDAAVAAIRVCAPDGTDVPAGGEGEIWARGPMTPLGVVGGDRAEGAAEAAGPEGWVRTGDLGLLEPDGTLRVLGRLRQTVIRGGWTISPAEVEAALHAHPDVAEAACVPVPDADLGERLCACLAPRPGHALPALPELRAFLAGLGLSRHQLPDRLLALETLPLGPTGKVSRRVLADLAAAPAGVGTCADPEGGPPTALPAVPPAVFPAEADTVACGVTPAANRAADVL